LNPLNYKRESFAMNHTLDGQVAAVTGAARGIGLGMQLYDGLRVRPDGREGHVLKPATNRTETP
jgi:hypothetical protein